MRVLLFGANGQVGWRLAQQLGDACIALTREQCDFATITEKQARAIIEEHAPDIIINAVGFTAVDAAEQQRDAAMQINAHAPAAIVRAAGNIPLIHFSTDYVFDGGSGHYRETHETHPLGAYGESKWEGERLIRQAGGHAYIVRLQWVYDTRGANFYRTMTKLMAQRAALRVVADQFGAPSAAPDIARAIIQALPLIANGTLPAGTYHLTSGGHTSWHGFACAIAASQPARVTESIEPITTDEYPTPALRPRDTRLDCSALAAHGIRMPHWRAAFAALMEGPCT